MNALHLPALPNPPSWFPGHMMKFTRALPALLKRTNIVLEIRDSRLPLTSINRTLEGALKKWRLERGWDPNNPTRRLMSVEACEHIVVFNKRDLVPEWGIEPFKNAMQKTFPQQRTMFASWQRQRDIRALSDMLIDIAKEYPHSMETNVLVIGMPNVGKSTLLNALRNAGIKGPSPKAFQTSANPGMTKALSTRLKLCVNPLLYAYDTPGVMLPYLGRDQEGAERGIKLALIAGIKEGLYDMEALAAYLLYRLNVLDPVAPAYLSLLPAQSRPTHDLEDFLTLLGTRMGMVRKGGEVDTSRAAVYFVRWWREEGARLSASPGLRLDPPVLSAESQIQGGRTQAWGFDFQWEMDALQSGSLTNGQEKGRALLVQEKMEEVIQKYIETTDREEMEEKNTSPTQVKKKSVAEEKARRKLKQAEKLARRTR